MEGVYVWWERWPSANIGVATGPASGLLVLDVDEYRSPELLAEIESRFGPLPETLTTRTGGGGRHIFFRYPDGAKVGNSASRLLTGLDVRGEGGYVVAPPSVHANGNVYAWEDPDAPLAPLPESILAALVRPAPPAPVPAAVVPKGDTSAYAEKALVGELQRLAEATEGTRNDTLNTAAFNLGQLVATGPLSESRVVDELLRAALAIGLSEHEARDTIRSGLESGKRNPRRVAPRDSGSGTSAASKNTPDGAPGAAPSEVEAVAAEKPTRRPRIEVVDVAEVRARVEARGLRKWLVEGLVPAGTYGILGAQDKAGKTWALLDLAVSVATGTPWLDRFSCQGDPGPVTLFLGEGDDAATVRRLSAILESRGSNWSDVDGMIGMCFRAPRLTVGTEMDEVRRTLEAHPPRLIACDPFYLSAPPGKGSDLYSMGEALGAFQEIAEDVGSALFFNVHWNKTGEGTGAQRFTGVGPGAWGRVLGSGAVVKKRIDPGVSDVTLKWEFEGSEIASSSFLMQRRVWADDPKDINLPLHYQVEVRDAESMSVVDELTKTEQRILAGMEGTTDTAPITIREIVSRMSVTDKPMVHSTVEWNLKGMAAKGLVDSESAGPGRAMRWWRI